MDAEFKDFVNDATWIAAYKTKDSDVAFWEQSC